MSHPEERLKAIRTAITRLAGADLATSGRNLLASLGYASPKTLDVSSGPASFLTDLNIDPARFEGGVARWRGVHFLFQLTGDELPALSRGAEPQTGGSFQRGALDSFVFLGIDLDDGTWPRKQLVAIVRELNRGFAMPAIILFRHAGHATLAVIDRRAHRRDPNRDVVGGRISLIKDIDLKAPHRAHVEILADLSLAQLGARHAPSDFRALYDAWLEALSAAELNKRFYVELADWFGWASTIVKPTFPPGQGEGNGALEIALIRLLTRLMFVWFIKQKGLVPSSLFEANGLAKLLKNPPLAHPEGNDFYLAILQNLFFATLNTEMDDRRWRKDDGGQSPDYLGHHVFRHASRFTDQKAAFEAFATVPFLNGGLFECLDTEVRDDDPRCKLATQERGRRILRIDGFSDQPANQPKLPNKLFFGTQANVDLSDYYERASRGRTITGLIDLFDRYKFTIEENTPLEEEAALDPELLGKVFENLLASYNEDTKTTARNKSGSFYTPREVVDFMVDEALVAYLAPKLPSPVVETGVRPLAPGLNFGAAPGELGLAPVQHSPAVAPIVDRHEGRLRALLNFASREHDFSSKEVDALIAAIESCRAIDPAVGSGAFPLGLLQKLVHILTVLDPGGQAWRARNRITYEENLTRATNVLAIVEQGDAVANAKAELERFDAAFASGHHADYTRKLFLIERCLHGVDIQPIAVQIAKLRCFISLAVEQQPNDARPNRGITPLPNLETKLVAANSLTPLHRKGQMQLRDTRIDVAQARLRDANRALFAAANGASKRKLQKRIHDVREQLITLLKGDNALTGDEAKLLAAWDPFDPNSFAPFFDPEWMFGLASSEGGFFDIALANPPYVRQEKIEALGLKKADLKRDYAAFAGTADLYIYFFERAVTLLKPGGALAFITSNKWYRAGYGAKLRAWLPKATRLRSVMDFGDAGVFEAIAYPTILIAKKRADGDQPSAGEAFQAMNWVQGDPVEGFPARFAAESFAMPQAELAATGWQLEPQVQRQLLARLRAGGMPLGEWCEGRFYYGIKTGLNEAFVIDGSKRAELIAADPASADIIKPFLRGRDIKRWQVEPADKWLIKIPSSENQRHPWSGLPDDKAEATFKKTYPSIYHWFTVDGRRDALIARSDQGRYFWELRSCAYYDAFDGPKVIIPAIEQRVAYAPDKLGFLSNDKTTIAVTDRPAYLLAILNSSVSWWLTQQEFSSKQGGFYEFKPMYVGKLPVPRATPKQQVAIESLVEALIAGAQHRPRIEALINAFVYELFFTDDLRSRGLSPFAVADAAGLSALYGLEGEALARAADNWSRYLSDPTHSLYATLFELQSIDSVRIIEGR